MPSSSSSAFHRCITAVGSRARTRGQVCGFFQLLCWRPDLELGGVLLLACPASAILGVSGRQQQHLGDEPTHPTLARRPVALGRLGPSLGIQKETPLLAFKRTRSPKPRRAPVHSRFQHASPLLAWAAYALATHICSFTFPFGVWGESRVLRVTEGCDGWQMQA